LPGEKSGNWQNLDLSNISNEQKIKFQPAHTPLETKLNIGQKSAQASCGYGNVCKNGMKHSTFPGQLLEDAAGRSNGQTPGPHSPGPCSAGPAHSPHPPEMNIGGQLQNDLQTLALGFGILPS
jgi:hypothetical protein